MGRGRAKAKQTKVARELKYSTPGMDLDRLQRDLATDPLHTALSGHSSDDDAELDDADDEDEVAGSSRAS